MKNSFILKDKILDLVKSTSVYNSSWLIKIDGDTAITIHEDAFETGNDAANYAKLIFQTIKKNFK